MRIIDFGDMPSEQAASYETPFEYVNTHVRPFRTKSKWLLYAKNWWLHMEPRIGNAASPEGDQTLHCYSDNRQAPIVYSVLGGSAT